MQPTPMRYTPALAHAATSELNAARSGCPSAMVAANIRYARALNAARTEQAEADYAADPEAFERRRHDDDLAATYHHYLEA